MKPTKTIVRLPLMICLLMALCGIARAGDVVNFSLSTDPIDPGASYTGFSEAGKGVNPVYTIGFQVTINSVNGTNVTLSPLAAFCCELQQSISISTYTFLADHLYNLASGVAGQAGTASSGIPIGGIGMQRAAYVSYLFDRYYISEALAGWTAAPTSTQAFQMSIWELTHDSDMDLRSTSGYIYVGTQSDTLRNNAIDLAMTMLQDVRNANISSSYVSTNFDICALTDPQYQDVILATKKGSSANIILNPILSDVIPEPATGSLMALVAVIGFWIRRRFMA